MTSIKRECPRRPREITKMLHMLEKLISLIFCSEIPHDELTNVVYLFYSDLLLLSKKIGKIVYVRPVPNAAPLMCRTKLNTVRLWSDFGATADSDGVLASDLIREGHGKYFSMRKICDLNSLTLYKIEKL